jgi:hypothetical protein
MALAVASLASTNAAALTFFDLATGDEGLLPDARSAALGRTRIGEATGGFTAASNPALLARLQDVSVSLGGGVLKLKETRSTPAYDSFDGFLVESIYVLNDEYQNEAGAGAAAAFAWGADRRVGVGISWSPVRDFQYDYSEEVRDNNAFTQPRDRLLAVNEVHSDGALEAFSLGAGGSVLPSVDLGATVQILRGERDARVETRFVQEDRVEFESLDLSDLSGARALFGAAWHPHHAVSGVIVYRMGATVSADARSATDVDAPVTDSIDLEYPDEVSFGAVWRPRAKLRTTVRAEASWTQWSDFEDGFGSEPDLEDVWDARIGIEHVFYNGFPVRFGIRYAPAPLDDEVATTAFTFGGGLDVGPLRADLAFEIANRNYRYPDLFSDATFGGDARVTTDLVEESATSAFVTLGARFAPFGG